MQRGSLNVIAGDIGSGKTTLLRVLLVFDDISSALDIQTEIKLYQRLRDIQIANTEWQPTILIASHNQWLCDRADQVITLDKGHIRND